jgi:lauroyl/myristoyl acyltransferase
LPVLPKRTPYYAYRAGAGLARLLPEPVGAALARGATRIGSGLMTERRKQVARNLRRVHGPGFSGPELHRAVAATFDSYGRYFYELFRLPTYEPEWIESHFRCPGIEHIAAGVAEGRGAVLALPHLGNWDFAGAWLALQGYRVTVVAEPVEPPELFDWFVETRARLGMRVVPLGPAAGTEVLKAVHANEVVCLLADRDLTGDGVEVEFFGERTTLPGGPALVALRGGAPLLPAGCYFRDHGSHETTILPPVPTARSGRIRDDLARVTQDLAHRFEDLIRVAPTHWHLLQPNWPSDRGSDPAPAHSGMR